MKSNTVALKRSDIKHNLVIIKINQTYHEGMSAQELYEYTRGFWKRKIESVKPAQYALAVVYGIVVEVYQIDKWIKAEQAENHFRNYDPTKHSDRISFVGEVAPPEIRDQYIKKNVDLLYKNGEADPVKLFLKYEENTGINTPLSPKRIIEKPDGSIRYICSRCNIDFARAPRCPECGQLVDENCTIKAQSYILRVGDDVSGMKIYEILNKYLGKNYTGWMKSLYEINEDFSVWFPTITAENNRPNGNYGGLIMWSNTLSPDKKVLISMNHDKTIDDISEEERKNPIRKDKCIIFARINGSFEFIGVFDDKLVLENKTLTYRHDRIAKGINFSTLELIEED